MEIFSTLLAFGRWIHRWPVNSPHKGQWHWALMFSLDLRLNKRLSKQSRGWWFETPWLSIWRHCNHLERRPRRSTNHQGVVDVTLDEIWPVPFITWLNVFVSNVYYKKVQVDNHARWSLAGVILIKKSGILVESPPRSITSTWLITVGE